MKHIAVIDIGKTNAKLALVEAGTLREIAVETRPNRVLPGPPWPHFDLEGHWDFLLHHLAAFHAAHGVDAISITTHGAAAVLLDAGYPAGALKGIPLLARTASLVAHILEEQTRPIGFKLASAAEQAMTYDGPPVAR